MATKQHKVALEQKQQEPKKLYYDLIYKATLVLFFFLILPQAPQFINHSLLTRNWELLHLLFVGVAVSYGLFSHRNHDTDKDKDKDKDNNSKFDTAQSLVSRFLQVSSFFEDDVETESPLESDETKVQTWNNQHHRNQPMLLVAPRLNHSHFHHRNPDKPLLLPIRSLNSRLSSDDDDDDDRVDDAQSLNSSTNFKRFSGSFNRNSEVEDKKKESVVVLPSPIPWRSRSGRMEPNKQEEADDASKMMLPSKEESRPVKSQTSSRASSRTRSLSPSLAKNAEDLVRKKGFYKSCPPPPPPPPPMMFHKSISMKPRYGEAPSFDKELKRSFTVSVGKNIKNDEEKSSMQRTLFRSDKLMGHASVPHVSEPAEKESFLDKVLVEEYDDKEDDDTETEDDDDDFQNEDNGKVPPLNGVESSKKDEASCGSGTISDEGPDVDKKADEFIAKFREQIRLQRIESIKRSTKSARNSSR